MTPDGSGPEGAPVEQETRTRVVLICVATGLVGILSAVTAALVTPEPWAHPGLALLLFTGAAVLQVVPVRLSHDGQGENLHLEECFLVAMAVYLSVPETLVAMGTAVTVGHVWHRRAWMKISFNAGQLVAAAAVGTMVAKALGADATPELTDRALAAGVAGALVHAVLSMISVAAIISFVQRTPIRAAVIDGIGVRVAVWGSSLALGLMVAVAMERRAWMIPLMFVPVALLQLTYSRSFRQYRERRQIERLYQATDAIRSTIDSNQVREEVVRAAHTILDAGTVRLVGSDVPRRDGALRAALDSTTSLEVRDRIRGGDWDTDDEFLLQGLASVASNALAQADLFERLRTITGSLAEGVIALDRAGRIEFVNPAVGEILGWRAEELLGRRPHDIVHAHDGGGATGCPLVLPLSTGRTAKHDDDLFTCKDGTLLPVSYTTAPVVRDGQRVGVVIAFHDVSERKTFEEQLTHQAFHDALTGLPNRAMFLDRLGHAQTRAARTGGLYALLFIDLDRFKVVNDSLGHHIGDDLLVQVAARLRTSLRPGDTLARFGGDEFVAILEDLDGEDAAVAITERLLSELRHPFNIADRDLSMSCSIGVVVGDGSRVDADETLREGDVAMYRAKARGKACYEVFRQDSDPAQLRRLDLEIELRGALDRGELELDYQPIVKTDTGEMTGVEALLRWRHPERGLVSPAEFIPLAEETGLILPLGRWVLEEACRQTREWEDRHPHVGPLVVSVNLSPRQFRQPDLGDQVAAALTSSGLDATRLCVEVTEGVMVDDVESATLTLHQLRDLGVSVSIDDFGTGYSSLSYLKRFPIDYVKIDRSFIRGLGEETVDSEIVRSVIRLAAAIGIRTVAEGVETEEQLRHLDALGCPLVQGYHIARPMPAAHFDACLAAMAVGRVA